MSREVTIFKEGEIPEGTSTIGITTLFEHGQAKIGFEIFCFNCKRTIDTLKLNTQHGRIICTYCHEDL